MDEIMRKYGFDIMDTGGGCRGYFKPFNATNNLKGYVLITSVNGPEKPESETEKLMVGYYFYNDDSGENFVTIPFKNLSDYLSKRVLYEGITF